MPVNKKPRCLLMVPSIKLDRYGERLDDMDVDSFIFDLEDSVAATHKDKARRNLRDFLAENRPQYADTFVRINGARTPYFKADLELLHEIKPDVLMIPKASNVQEIEVIERFVDEYEERHGLELPLYLTIETLEGYRNCDAILECSRKAILCSPGYCDLSNELDIEWPDITQASPINKILMDIIITAKFHSIPVLDAVSREITESNRESLLKEIEYGRSVGMIGKVAVNPRQVDAINSTYNQSQLIVESYEKIKAFEELEDGSTVLVNSKGRIENVQSWQRAERIIAEHRRKNLIN
jgi:citrate lyase subunit beta/citryl-CoA lyase